MSQMLSEMRDGEYTGEIVDIIEETTAAGDPKVSWILKIVGGEYDGALVEKKYHLKNDKAKDFLKKELKLIGYEVADSTEFEAKKSQIIGTKIVFTAKNTDEGWLVLYVKGLVGCETKNAAPKKKGW